MCLISRDGFFTQMTFDAGDLEVRALPPWGRFDWSGALFSFNAVAGHTYVIRANRSESMRGDVNRWRWVSVRLEDWSDGKKVIAEQRE